jgi:hypothetical protein
VLRIFDVDYAELNSNSLEGAVAYYEIRRFECGNIPSGFYRNEYRQISNYLTGLFLF